LPKVLLFAPCERVLVNDLDNNISLITVLQEISISITSPEKLPDESNVVTRWEILAVWIREPSDDGKRFEQVCTMSMPDGRNLTPFRVVFSMEKRAHRQVVTLRGFPVSKVPGECVLKLWLREDVEDAPLQQVAEFPLQLKHDPAE